MITKTAFILAAGEGTRLRPHTNTKPKPMVKVAGKEIIQHIIDKCNKVGISKVIINLFYLGDIIKSHFKNENFIFSEEKEVLDTGGGVKKALHHIQDNAFFLINGDAFWTENQEYNAFEALDNAWNPEKMDILLLLQPVDSMELTKGVGDYNIDDKGKAIRSHNKNGSYMFAGVRLTKKSVFNDIEEEKFSFLKLMDEAEKKGKLFAVINEGDWHHISTPEDLQAVNNSLGFQTENSERSTA